MRVESLPEALPCRARLFELDPYLSFAKETIFDSSKVPDEAVTLEQMEWHPRSELPAFLQEQTRQETAQPSTLQSSEPVWLKNTETPSADVQDDLPVWLKDLETASNQSQDEMPGWLKQSDEDTASNGGIAGRPLRVFLCHSSGDKAAVGDLDCRLKETKNIEPWLDEENILAGQNWELEIQKAVKTADVVIVCLSGSSASKEGYLQKEIKIILDIADQKPEDTIFIIPLKLDPCEVPERLQTWQWINNFEQGAYNKLLRSLRKRAETLKIGID